MNVPVNVAVWGLGNHAVLKVLPALQQVPGVHIYGVCSRRAGVVETLARDHGCRGWTDPSDMLRHPAVDVVYVATPISEHAGHARDVLAAGKHLWCEKPITDDPHVAAALTADAEKRGLVMAETFLYLYHAQFRYMQDVVRLGRVGAVRSVTCRFGIPPLHEPGFRYDPSLGGGAFLDVGCYPVSALVALFPDASAEVVFAEITSPAGRAVDSAGLAVLRYDNGARATLEWGTDCAYRSELDIWGDAGSVWSERPFSKHPAHPPQFRCIDLHGNARIETGSAEAPFPAMFAAFLELWNDPVAAARERGMIVRRAEILGGIRRMAARGVNEVK
jgi:predicted dehydrogenase